VDAGLRAFRPLLRSPPFPGCAEDRNYQCQVRHASGPDQQDFSQAQGLNLSDVGSEPGRQTYSGLTTAAAEQLGGPKLSQTFRSSPTNQN